MHDFVYTSEHVVQNFFASETDKLNKFWICIFLITTALFLLNKHSGKSLLI
jgi:hypothetical protein